MVTSENLKGKGMAQVAKGTKGEELMVKCEKPEGKGMALPVV